MQLDAPLEELFVRAVALSLLVLLAGIRLFFHARVGTLKESPFSSAEGPVLSVLRVILGLTFVSVLLLSLVVPDVVASTSFSLPAALRVVGVSVFAVSLAGLVWVHRALGRNFSPTLLVRDDNHLVEDGPYRFVRHPMYTVMIGCVLGVSGAAPNVVVVTAGLATMSIVLFFRTPKEEEMMIETFGDAYRRYRQRTGAVFPTFGRIRLAPAE